MATDLVVAAPTFLDMTFVGLSALPRPGEERFAGSLLRTPGGGGITAVAAARLGLSVVVAAPLGEDLAGEYLRQVFAAEGVGVGSRRSRNTPTTVVMPIGGEGAMVTVDEGVRAYAADVAALEPRAVVSTLQMLHTVPPGADAYVVCGDDDAAAYAGRPPKELTGARAVFLNQREACSVTGAATVEAATQQLGAIARTAIVTLDDDQIVALVDGEPVEPPPPEPGVVVVDRTGSRDLLAAAHCWAERRGASPADCVAWAAVYARLAVSVPTAVGGAVDEPTLLEAGARVALAPPPGVGR